MERTLPAAHRGPVPSAAPSSADSLLVRSAEVLPGAGAALARGGVALVLFWIGALKFTAREAEGIRGLVENSPLLSWMYSVWSVQGASAVIGAAEIVIAALILLRPWAPRASAVGAALAVGTFATTLSFMLTTPGVWDASLGGFPALGAAGQFLVKDVVFLGVSLWVLGDSLHAVVADRTTSR